MSAFLDADLRLLRFINLDLATPFLTRVMLLVTDKNNWYPFIALAVVFLLYAGRKLPYSGNWFQRINARVFVLGLVLCIALSDQAATFLKHSVNRTRPNRDEQISSQIDCRLGTGGRRSFPSNHAANSAAMAVFVSLVYPPLVVPALFFSFVVGFSRVYLGVHYPSDVLAGWLAGSAAALLVWSVLRKRLRRFGLLGVADMFRFPRHFTEIPPGNMWIEKEWNTLDGVLVKGFLLEGSSKIVIFIHGLGDSICSGIELGEKLHEIMGVSFLLVPLRGCDNHPVKKSTGGPEEAHDVLGALRFAVAAGYHSNDTVVYGVSMGGASVIKASALAGELIPSGIVIHATYVSFFATAMHRAGRFGCAVLKLLVPAQVRKSLESFSTLYWLELLNRACSVEYIYGGRDRSTPEADGRLLLMHTPSEKRRLTVLSGMGHPTRAGVAAPEVVVTLSESLKRIWNEEKGGNR